MFNFIHFVKYLSKNYYLKYIQKPYIGLYSYDSHTQSLISIVNNTFLFPFSFSLSLKHYVRNTIYVTQNYNKYKESFVDETINLPKLIEKRGDVYREWLSLFNNLLGNVEIEKFNFLKYDKFEVDLSNIEDNNNMFLLEKALEVLPTNINYIHTYLLTVSDNTIALIETYNQFRIYPQSREFKIAISTLLNGKSRVYYHFLL